MALADLRPIQQTSEQASEAGKKGGVASGEARRRKKMMRQQMEILLELPIKSKRIKEQLKELGIDDDEF